MTSATQEGKAVKPLRPLESAVIFFAGDSGDGMQLVGTQFTDTSAIFGNDVATFPDFPAEIRAPAGTVPGVSGFQVNFSSKDIHTPGDEVDALIAMNPAAFKAHINDVKTGGIVIVNESEFEKVNLRKAAYPEGYNPIDDEKYARKYRLYKVPITRLNEDALKETGLGAKDAGRCKNMWSLGLIFWLYDRSLDVTVNYLETYFGKLKKKPEIAEANIKALKAGYFFGETAEIFTEHFKIDRATVAPGEYTKITGNEALAMGLVAASKLSDKTLVYGSYPITPASSILEYLAGMRHFGVKTVQAEDEIAAVCVAIGAAYAGQLAITGTSGPGLCLKAEAVNLAIVAELPLVIVNVQRGGPSTGLPTKTEQSDLLQAMYGRNGDSPLVIVAPQSPADCFNIAIDACRIAMQHMVPVIILTDGYLANGAEPWKIPDHNSYKTFKINHDINPENFQPYRRDENFTRPWAVPGTPGLMHRLGGLEKADVTGNVNYDPANHQRMTDLRHAKVAKVADDIGPLNVRGDETGDLLVLGWGGTYGSIISAVDKARAAGKKVSSAHLRYLNPMPRNLGEVLRSFKKVLIPELNMGQLRLLIRGKHLIDARGLNKVQGKPFLVEEIEQAIDLMLTDQWPADREFIIPREHKVSPNDPPVTPTKAGSNGNGEG
ncbi:MAG: 2-oxoacid:acceptor oxidoreductase subunit alpha [Phycisphaeraceae bacterium]